MSISRVGVIVGRWSCWGLVDIAAGAPLLQESIAAGAPLLQESIAARAPLLVQKGIATDAYAMRASRQDGSACFGMHTAMT